MLRSFLIGLVAGQRGMAPLALLAGARRNGRVPDDMPLAPLFDHPVIAAGAVAMGGLEMAGDKPSITSTSGLSIIDRNCRA